MTTAETKKKGRRRKETETENGIEGVILVGAITRLQPFKGSVGQGRGEGGRLYDWGHDGDGMG